MAGPPIKSPSSVVDRLMRGGFVPTARLDPSQVQDNRAVQPMTYDPYAGFQPDWHPGGLMPADMRLWDAVISGDLPMPSEREGGRKPGEAYPSPETRVKVPDTTIPNKPGPTAAQRERLRKPEMGKSKGGRSKPKKRTGLQSYSSFMRQVEK